jgi:hypothetical protein
MFKLIFKTDSEAFDQDYLNPEAARVLEDIAKQLRNGFMTGPAIDRNGNKVGTFKLTFNR